MAGGFIGPRRAGVTFGSFMYIFLAERIRDRLATVNPALAERAFEGLDEGWGMHADLTRLTPSETAQVLAAIEAGLEASRADGDDEHTLGAWSEVADLFRN